MMKIHLVLLTLLLAWGCSKEEFSGTPKSEKYTANAVEVFQNLTCANSTLIKPPVDILYVVDNSLSAGYLKDTVKLQLQQTIQTVSNQFDYRIMVAPLLQDGGSDTFRPVITNGASSMPSSVNVVSLENLSFFGNSVVGNAESGLQRSINLIDQNSVANGGGVFRNGAHTIVVLVSNEDDDSMYNCSQFGCVFSSSKLSNMQSQYLSLRNRLQAQQLRFFSVVAHSSCTSNGESFVEGRAYKEMSAYMYANASIPPQAQPTDQAGRSTKDSYDLCGGSFAVYQGVNSSIQQEILGHTYDHWLVSASTVIDTNDIVVSKVSSSGTVSAVSAGGPNGWSYAGYLTNQNTRVLPNPGEPKTGYFIQLSGSAQVVYPDCLVVRTRTPTEFYGYAVIPSAPKTPVADNVVVTIRGSRIPFSTSNGWSYEGYRENQNIKVNSNGTPNTSSPLTRTGYFIKLNGTAIYASGDSISVDYTPGGI
jgi:hypothetical protein